MLRGLFCFCCLSCLCARLYIGFCCYFFFRIQHNCDVVVARTELTFGVSCLSHHNTKTTMLIFLLYYRLNIIFVSDIIAVVSDRTHASRLSSAKERVMAQRHTVDISEHEHRAFTCELCTRHTSCVWIAKLRCCLSFASVWFLVLTTDTHTQTYSGLSVYFPPSF